MFTQRELEIIETEITTKRFNLEKQVNEVRKDNMVSKDYTSALELYIKELQGILSKLTNSDLV